MRFWVDAGQVASYGEQVSRAAEHAKQAREYVGKNCELGSADNSVIGFFNQLVAPHEDIVPQVRQHLERAEQVLAAAGKGLGAAAAMYGRTDVGTAARLDSTYPAGSVNPRSKPRDEFIRGQPSLDKEDPVSHLGALGKPEEFKDPAKLYNDFGDLLSPTQWISAVLDMTIGVNPLTEITQLITGDWEGYRKCANAWQQLGKASDAMAKNLRSGLLLLDKRWDGNAADSAFEYFDYLIRSLESMRDMFGKLHKEYELAAEAVWHFAKAASDILKGILDNAILAAVFVAAGTITAKTGVGAVLGYGLAAIQCWRIVTLWNSATKMINATQNVIHGAIGAMQNITSDPAFRAMPLPVIDYQHPGVAR